MVNSATTCRAVAAVATRSGVQRNNELINVIGHWASVIVLSVFIYLFSSGLVSIFGRHASWDMFLAAINATGILETTQ